MNNKYQMEIHEFEEHFQDYHDAKIVLYGIGRYTATLCEGLTNYTIVGLMDKDPQNIGREMFGKPVLDLQSAEEKADLIIINTSETYWDVIYERIHESKIPVFYKNGERAVWKKEQDRENPYRTYHKKDLIKAIREAEVVSFDFFDTLFMRRVCNPRDVFDLLAMEIVAEWPEGRSYQEVRDEAKRMVAENYDLDELYEKIGLIQKDMTAETLQRIKDKEIALEKRLLKPRQEVLNILKTECMTRKLVITTDMYLPESFYQEVLAEYHITEYTLLLSNKEKKSKATGELYDELIALANGRKLLHIGDHKVSDIRNAEEKGIQTYHLPSGWDLLNASDLASVLPQINTIYASVVMGMVIAEACNNPFVYEDNHMLKIENSEQMGYVVFGPVILSFLLWLSHKRNKDRLIFMARDGYFLKEDYELIESGVSDYLYISRQLAMTASIQPDQKDEILEFASMPYSGTIGEMIEDRFGGIQIALEDQKLALKAVLQKYDQEITEYIVEVRKNYQKYLQKMQLDATCAVVDIGFYGNNQKYLNKLLGLAMKGYYINANLSEDNPNARQQVMQACFQGKEDKTGEHSEILKKQIFIESFLTAPYGMIKGVDENGNSVCAPDGNNQKYFKEKICINQGVKQLITEYKKIMETTEIPVDTKFVDTYYGIVIKAFQYADEVKKSFYNDNAMMNRLESMLFY